MRLRGSSLCSARSFSTQCALPCLISFGICSSLNRGRVTRQHYECVGFYKVTFYILSLLSPRLIKVEFEEILHILGEIVRSEIFQIDTEEKLINYIRDLQGLPPIPNPTTSLKQEITKKFKITNSLIRKLENEYHHFILNFNSKLKEYQKK